MAAPTDNTVFEYRGVSDLVYAEVTADTAENYTTGEVKPLAGLANVTRSKETSSEAHYYDNVPKIVITAEGNDTVTFTVSAIPLPVLADINGKLYDEALGALIDQPASTKYFAVGYKTQTTDGHEMYVWRYKGQFSVPDENINTKDNGTEASGQELTFTGVATTHEFTKGGSVPSMTVDTTLGLADVSTFFAKVTTPDMLKPVGAGGDGGDGGAGG